MRLVESPTSNRWVVILPSCLVKYNDGFGALEYSTGPFELIVSNQRLWLPGSVIGANQSVISQAISSNASFPAGTPYRPFWKKDERERSRKQQLCSIKALIRFLFTFSVFLTLSSSPISPPHLSSLLLCSPLLSRDVWPLSDMESMGRWLF